MNPLFHIAFLLMALLPFSAAQDSLSSAIQQLPACALTCLVAAIETSPCSATDQHCLCTDETLQANVTTCVLKSCTLKEALLTKNATSTSCNDPIRNRSKAYSNISITFGVISAAVVLARILYKLIVTTVELGLDDYFVLITLLVGVPSSVLNVRGLAAYGIGRDVWTLPYTYVTDFIRVLYVMEILYFAEVALLKLSLLFFYKRIFPGAAIKRLLWATVIFDSAFGILFVIVAIFQCRPISYYWNKWDGEGSGQCVNVNALAWANAAFSIVLDIWMLAIPMSQLVHLKLHWKKKIGVGIMFCVGTFVTVVSVLRLQSLVDFAKSSNPTWDQFQVCIWSTIEINVGIICVCMPAIRVILLRFFPKLLGRTRNSEGQYYLSSNSKSRNRSRTFGQEAPSAALRDKKSIMYSKTFEVETGVCDETRLVEMDDLEIGSKRRGDISRPTARC